MLFFNECRGNWFFPAVTNFNSHNRIVLYKLRRRLPDLLEEAEVDSYQSCNGYLPVCRSYIVIQGLWSSKRARLGQGGVAP